MNTDNTPEEYGPLIESMCKWQKARDLLEVVSDWLEAAIVVKDPNESDKVGKYLVSLKHFTHWNFLWADLPLQDHLPIGGHFSH